VQPKLRFKGYENSPWRETSLRSISNDSAAYGMNAAAISFDGLHKYLRITDIDETLRVFKPNPLTSPSGQIDESFKLKENDIVFARTGASVGKSYLYNKKDGNLYFAGFLIKFNIKNGNPFFVFTTTLLESYKKFVTVNSMRSGQPGLNAEELSNFKFYAPSLAEQEKIASFLSLVDKKISLLTQEHELLTTYKNGVMQKIFNQEIRFKNNEGCNYPEWLIKKVEEIGYTFNGLVGKSANDFGTGSHYISYKQIFDGSKIDVTKCPLVKIQPGEKQSQVKYGDALFTTSSETPDEVGYCSVLLENVDDVYLNSFSFGFRFHSFDLILPEFARFLFFSESFRKQVILLAQGITRYNISKGGFLKIQVNLPCIEEQKKIASFLSELEDKIALTQKQIDLTKQYKQGLLQQMFV
jgi:type I restriction enzyme S subunit